MDSNEGSSFNKYYVLAKTISRPRPVRQKEPENFIRRRVSTKQLRDLKYEQFEPLYKLWCEYYKSLLNLTTNRNDERLSKADYHGCLLMVSESDNPSQIGLTGIVVRETRQTFQLITKKNRLLTIPKQGTSFQFAFEGKVFTLIGDAFRFQPAQRIKKRKNEAIIIPLDEIDDKYATAEQQMSHLQQQGLFKPRPVSRMVDQTSMMTPLEATQGMPDIARLFTPRTSTGKEPSDNEKSTKGPEILKLEDVDNQPEDMEKKVKSLDRGVAPQPEQQKSAHEDGIMHGALPNSIVGNHNNLIRVKTPEVRGDKDTKFTECPFAEFGCEVTGEAIQVRRHIRDESALHLSQMCDAVLNMSNQSKVAVTETGNLYAESEETVRRVRQIGSLYSSQFVWRISNYSEAFANARRGRPAIIYSAPFFSHRQGYKLAAAIALYGDGDAIGEFNSVFVTILRGEHDAILPWPFQCPITFTLINLKGGVNVEASVTPRATESNMPFLGRPHSDRNPAFGIKTFTDLRMMENDSSFVVKNTCFLKVDVDLDIIQKYIG